MGVMRYQKAELLVEAQRIDRDVQWLTQNQNALFGLKPDKEAELLAFIDKALTDKQSSETFSYGEVDEHTVRKINTIVKRRRYFHLLIMAAIGLTLTSYRV